MTSYAIINLNEMMNNDQFIPKIPYKIYIVAGGSHICKFIFQNSPQSLKSGSEFGTMKIMLHVISILSQCGSLYYRSSSQLDRNSLH